MLFGVGNRRLLFLKAKTISRLTMRPKQSGQLLLFSANYTFFYGACFTNTNQSETSLDPVLTNPEDIIKEVKTGGTLSCSDCALVAFCDLKKYKPGKERSQIPEPHKSKIPSV